MITIDGKEYRNLEEQVLKNMEDIETLQESVVDITTQDNTFTGNNIFEGNLYKLDQSDNNQFVANNVMTAMNYYDDGDLTGTVAVTSSGASVKGLVSPVYDNDAANKQYVDNKANSKVNKLGQAYKVYGTDGTGNDKAYAISKNPDGFTSNGDIAQRGDYGNLYVPITPQDNYSATSKSYVDQTANTKVAKVNASNIVYGRGANIEKVYSVGTAATANNIPLRTAQGQITVPLTPTANNDAASKKYVDDQIATIDTSNYVQKSTNANIAYGTNPDGTPKLWGVGNISPNYLVNRTTLGNIILPTPSNITGDNYAASKAYVDSVASAAGSTYTVQVTSNLTQATVVYGWKQGKMITFYGVYTDNLQTGFNAITVANTDTINHGFIQCGDEVMYIQDTTGRYEADLTSQTADSVNGKYFFGILWLV